MQDDALPIVIGKEPPILPFHIVRNCVAVGILTLKLIKFVFHRTIVQLTDLKRINRSIVDNIRICINCVHNPFLYFYTHFKGISIFSQCTVVFWAMYMWMHAVT